MSVQKDFIALFEEQSAASPADRALLTADEELSYGALDQQSSSFANSLQQDYGVAKGDVVGLMLSNSTEMIIAVLGILKAGAVLLPMEPKWPEKRKQFIIREANMKLLILDSDQLFDADFSDTQVLAFDIQFDGGASPVAKDWRAVERHEDDLTYIIYTSGSTGNPKGVMVNAGSLSNYLQWANEYYFHNAKGFTFSLFTPLSFDLTLTCIFSTLVRGDKLYIAKEASVDSALRTIFDPQTAVNTVKLTPSHVAMLSALPLESTNVSTVILGGEKLMESHVEILRGLNKDIQIFNEYGPTEATIGCIVKEVVTLDDVHSIGKPISNTSIVILYDFLKPQPKGLPGEIYVGGKCLAAGYLNNPELTATKFITDPTKPSAGEVIYATGDMARWLPNGEVQLIGRTDDQEKIRGFRIEPTEIQTQLQRHDLLEDCAVIAFDNAGEQQLCAFYVGQSAADPAGLSQFLAQWLPEYMIPSKWVELDSIPLTINGKVDKNKLVSLVPKTSQTAYEAPQNELQHTLVQIWEEALEKEKIGINDNFFDLGGHSIKAISIVAAIYEQLKAEVELSDVFNAPTIAALSEIIAQSASTEHNEIKPVSNESSLYDLSHGQKRLFVLNKLQPSNLFNVFTVNQLKGRLDKDAFSQSFNFLISRHEILRTVYEDRDGVPYQKVLAPRTAGFEVQHIEAMGVDQARLDEIIEQESNHEFDLQNGPLIRVTLIQRALDTHYLLINLHHIISDDRSLQIIASELSHKYLEILNDSLTHQEDLKIQYKDYAHWQNTNLSNGQYDAAKAFWFNQFRESVPVVNIPGDFERPAIKSYQGKTLDFEIPQALVAKLDALTRQEDASLYIVLLTAVKVFLAKYCHQEHMLIGIPATGRFNIDLKEQIGFYLNLLPIDSEIAFDKTFREQIKTVKGKVLDAFDHQHYPFDMLVDDLDLKRDLSRSPIFDVMVSLNDQSAREDIDFGDLEVTPIAPAVQYSKYDLSFYFTEQADGLAVTIEYSTDLFQSSRIERIRDYFLHLVTSVTGGEAEVPVKQLTYIPVTEQQQLVEVWNSTYRAFDEHKGLHTYFEDQVVLKGEATALVFEDQLISYTSLNQGANKIAHHLLSTERLQKGAVVGVMMDRRPEMVMSILGIIKAGGCYLPIDPEFPKDRIAYLMEDSGAAVLLVDRQKDEDSKVRQVVVDQVLSSALPVQNINDKVQGADKAYMIYTSGSTGQPKGVMIPHRAVTNFMQSMEDALSIGTDERFLAQTTISFDISILELFLPLVTGNQLILANSSQYRDPVALQHLLNEHEVTVMQATPSLWFMLLEAGWKGNAGLRAISGGEYLSDEIGRQLLDLTGSLWNLYGPTETTIWSTCKQLRNEADLSSIGQPIANTQIYLLDSNGQLVPSGVPGEVYIGGVGLALGYHGKPELTAERFVQSDIAGGTRLYRTGDLARWNEKGELEPLGRIDDQVKVRGHRIEPGEVQAHLNAHPDVEQSHIHLHRSGGDQLFIAYYIRKTESLTATELRNHLKAQLPDYMVPDHFVALQAFPLTPNGKLDRSKLPLPGIAPQELEQYVAPETTAEQQLQPIWQQVLKLPQVSVQGNFFDLGGHSLKAIQLLSKINSELNTSLIMSDLFSNPTIADLAQVLDGGKKLPALNKVPDRAQSEFDLSPGQQRLWVLSKLGDGNLAYNISLYYEFKGKIDLRALNSAFTKLIERHEVLSTNVIETGNTPKVIIRDRSAFEVSRMAVSSDTDEIREVITHEQSVPFDLANDPLMRALLVETGAESAILVITIHHIISDAWSIRILIIELVQRY